MCGLRTLLLLGLAAASSASRDVVNFDFSWKHHLGEPPSPRSANCTSSCGEDGFNYGDGGHMIGVVKSKEDCCAACAADPTCLAWDMVTEDDGSQKKGDCWIKPEDAPKVANAKRVSGRLAPPDGPALPNAWAQPGFDDSAWESVDAPHDMLIGGTFSQANSNKQAFLARGAGFYRKHFDLPAAWQHGSSVWIYLEGVFHETQTWLNGHSLGNHSAGYTSFWYRLDNVPGVVWGGSGGSSNVLAVADDASTGTVS
jgi:beta-galactosidase